VTLAATATGFPALLIILGILGLLVSIGIAIGGRRSTAGRVSMVSAAAIVLGVVLANL
jgi:hypothetical protein